MSEYLSDIGLAFLLVLETSAASLLRSWILVPLGIVLMLLACFGVDVIFKSAGVSFPASVACLILLFFGLLMSEWLLGGNRTRKVVAVIDVPAGWALRWINVFFIPTFVLLPLSPSISFVEVLKIIAVFVVGFLVMVVLTAYMTRGLQIISGSSKRAHAERADELGPEMDDIPTIQRLAEDDLSQSAAPTPNEGSQINISSTTLEPMLQDVLPARVQGSREFMHPADTDLSRSSTHRHTQIPLPPARSRMWAAYISGHLDWFIYAATLVFVGIPVYYAADYAMPLQLTITVLVYFGASTLPPSWRRYLHPVLVSALGIVLILWIFGLTKRENLSATLSQYRTGLRYLQLWEGAKTNTYPGAGDMFGTILDASIVSLALPMYQYRRELRQHFAAIIVPNIVVSIASLFAYPALCFAIGISPTRSLAFAARSLTLALATPAMENLGGDTNTVAALAIMSGIIGALIGQQMLTRMKIPEDDYVTRGVTLGANSSAIATAILLKTDPRAAALSSLSMSLFGTITVLFTSIPQIKELVRSLVGL